eukprot:613435-Rhodomonas_salina.3
MLTFTVQLCLCVPRTVNTTDVHFVESETLSLKGKAPWRVVIINGSVVAINGSVVAINKGIAAINGSADPGRRGGRRAARAATR